MTNRGTNCSRKLVRACVSPQDRTRFRTFELFVIFRRELGEIGEPSLLTEQAKFVCYVIQKKDNN